MKILVTGCSLQQCGGGTRQQYQTVMSMHVQALRDLGHEVAWRPVLINDEEALESDVVIVGLVPFLSVAGHYVYPVLNLISRAEAAGVRLIFAVDDWQYPRISDNLLTVGRGLHRLVREAVFKGRPGWDWATGEGASDVEKLVERLMLRPWPEVIYPAFGWGRHHLLGVRLPAQRHVALDPTSYTRSYQLERAEPSERQRRWVLGTLSDQSKWLEKLGASWHVHQAGRPKEGAPMVSEQELVQQYAGSWGVLSPQYLKVAGSGWWRNRFVYAAMAGAVIFADENEVRPLGEPYLVPLEKVESLSDAELSELAAAQSEELRRRVWTRAQYHEKLEDLVRGK
jgi:hypothetical protein